MIYNPVKWYKIISAVLVAEKEAKKLMEEAKNEVVVEGKAKPGWKTSEFWLGVIGVVSTVGAALAPMLPASALACIASVGVIVPSVYIVARTVAKQTKSTADDVFLDKLAEKLKPVIKLDPPLNE